MDPDKTKSLQNELLKIKKGLKDWEYTFFKSHQRKPTIKDIQERPKVERVYKDYNKKKKQLRQLSATIVPDTLSQPVLYDSQSSPSSSQQKRRRSSQASVEYIRSPSHRLSRMKYVDHLERPATPLDFGSSSSQTTDQVSQKSNTNDEDSFWLGSSQSSSQNSLLFMDDTNKRRKKKNTALEQRLFGHLIWKPTDTLSPALKAEKDTLPPPDNDPLVDNPLVDDLPSTHDDDDDDDDDLTVKGLIITERELDPFRHFDPTLVNQLQGDLVMPGLFASSRARSTIMVPMMKDDVERHQRIMEAIRLGTLGERRQDDGPDQDLKQFMEENTDSLADDMDDQDDPTIPKYKKKFTQKRQTKLHKCNKVVHKKQTTCILIHSFYMYIVRYVETTPSNL
ncbi:hypothetical protein BC941DRAFT_436830 [Chlamydoabsidia padenii]|nr:hypothetical protein BC941DRAFT_436830 [Chlamydoabsidia padenii]